MKIVFYCSEEAPANYNNYLEIGASGTVSALLLVSHGLAMLGHEVTVLNRSESGNFGSVQYFNTNKENEVINHVNRIGSVDVFIANGSAARIYQKHEIKAGKKVCWVHNFIDQKPLEEAICCGKIDYIVCISHNQLGTWWLSPVFQRVTSIPNCVDLDVLNSFKVTDFSENKIMYIGATRESKGFHDGLRIFRKFHSLNPEYKFYVAGSASLHGTAGVLSANGIFEQEYEERCLRELLYDDSGAMLEEIVLLGRIPRKGLLEHLSNTRVAMVNPSWTSEPETFCVSAVEAQAVGVPVVSTFRGGLPEVIDNGKSGILVKNRNDWAMVEAIERITRDRKIAVEFSVNGRTKVFDKFGIIKISKEWDKKLKHMIAGKPFKGNMHHAIRSKIRHKLRR